jgi:hypothetical protein
MVTGFWIVPNTMYGTAAHGVQLASLEFALSRVESRVLVEWVETSPFQPTDILPELRRLLLLTKGEIIHIPFTNEETH